MVKQPKKQIKFLINNKNNNNCISRSKENKENKENDENKKSEENKNKDTKENNVNDNNNNCHKNESLNQLFISDRPSNIEDIKPGAMHFQRSDSVDSEGSNMKGMVFVNYFEESNFNNSTANQNICGEYEENFDSLLQDKFITSVSPLPLTETNLKNNNNNNNTGNSSVISDDLSSSFNSSTMPLPNNGKLKRNDCTLNSSDLCFSHTPSR